MSLAVPKTRPAATRDRLMAVLGAVDGLDATSYPPDQAVAGASWPRWVQTTYDGHLCSLATDTYECLVTLPASYIETTIDQGDAFRDTVALELSKVGRVLWAEPVQITFNDRQAMPGLRFRITVT